MKGGRRDKKWDKKKRKRKKIKRRRGEGKTKIARIKF
jgi:hypothetical protein